MAEVMPTLTSATIKEGKMKSQKKLDRFKLTEEEKRAIRKQERYEGTIDSIIMVLAIIAGIVMLIAFMEIFG